MAASAYLAAGACVATARVEPQGPAGSASVPKGILVEVAAGSVDPPSKAPAEPWYTDGRVCTRAADTSTPRAQLGCGSQPSSLQGRAFYSFDETFTSLERRRHPGACCYEQEFYAIGRPLRTLSNEAVLADSAPSHAWRSGAPHDWASRVPDDVRGTLAARWLSRASGEHASVAEFARLANALVALGAPSSLVRGAHAAALDEVRHAADAYALASALLGSPTGPAPLSLSRSRPAPRTRAELVAHTLLDGCLGETLASVEARAQAERTTLPSLKEVFQRVAAEEADHAVLAFGMVSWAIATASPAERREIGSALREVVALSERLEQEPAGAQAPSDEPTDLAPYGELTVAERAREHALAARELLLPVFRGWEVALRSSLARDEARAS